MTGWTRCDLRHEPVALDFLAIEQEELSEFDCHAAVDWQLCKRILPGECEKVFQFLWKLDLPAELLTTLPSVQ